jgi:hypothetical protein
MKSKARGLARLPSPGGKHSNSLVANLVEHPAHFPSAVLSRHRFQKGKRTKNKLEVFGSLCGNTLRRMLLVRQPLGILTFIEMFWRSAGEPYDSSPVSIFIV